MIVNIVHFAEDLNWSGIAPMSAEKKEKKVGQKRSKNSESGFYATFQIYNITTYALSETSSVSPSEPEEVP